MIPFIAKISGAAKRVMGPGNAAKAAARVNNRRTSRNNPKLFRDPEDGYFKRILDKAWVWDSLIQRVDSSLPSQTRIVEVACVGGPRSRKESVYYVALSIAFGTISRTVRSSDCAIDVMIDHVNKAVKVKMSFQYSGVLANTESQFSSDSGAQLIRQAPISDIFGADWPGFLQGTLSNGDIKYYRMKSDGQEVEVEGPYLPGIDQSNGKPSGNPILTHKPDYNYQPMQDNVAIDYFPLSILTQVLSGAACEKVHEPESFYENQKNPPQGVNPSKTLLYSSRFATYFNSSFAQLGIDIILNGVPPPPFET